MAEQTDPPSLSALTRESNRWCNSEVVGTRRSHQGSQKRGPQRSPAGRRPERRALPEEAEPAPAKRARRTTRNQQPSSSTPHDSPAIKQQRNSRRSSKRDSVSYNYKVPDDCVARCTRSKSALKPESSEPQSGKVAAHKSYNFSYLNRANHTFDVAAPSSSTQLSFNNQVEGALFPLDERDFAYSPFSSSTLTDLIDSDYSVYTPTASRSRCRKRKRSSKARLKLSKKRSRHPRKSFEETQSKEIKIESRKSNLPSSSKSRSGEGQRRRSLTPGSEASGSREPAPRRSLIPRLVGCAYPLRNRHNTSAPSTSKTRDGSVSSTASEASSQRAPSCLRNSSGGRPRKSSTPPLPKGAADSGYKSQSSPKNKLVIVPRDLPYLRQTDARRSIAAASGCNLGKCLSRGTAASSRQRRETTDKRQWAGSSGTGCGGWRRRGARPADMPQQNTHHTTNNAKRDKKGKSSLGSCASSGGGAGGSAARRQLQQHAADQQPPVSTSAAVASTSSNHNQQQAAASNMTGGQSIEMKSKGKAPPSNATGSAGGADDCGGGGGGGAAGGESSSEEGEVGRLQALLEARGLPPHLLGALGPRMQHLLHRTMGASTSASKATQLVAGLQASGDEGQQLQAVIELCQLLVMGNEDTLAGFPVRQAVPALLTLLAMDHNFDMMNHACRALTYMMEALPRSSGAVALAVPAFLEKLQAITCMDVAEQSLTALDMLSRRHSKAILQARGVSACLMYLDFFSINAQRAALSITANCCQNLTAEEFHFVRDSLQLLANRLTQQDKKSVESVCLAFSRLVDSYQNDPVRLQEITTPELLTNLQQLLVVSPPLISTGTFMTVIRMLTMLCAACPALAVALHQRSIADTLLYLLTGSTVPQHGHQIELVERSPQELYEITSLVAELMPSLPPDPLFAVDAHLDRPGTHTDNAVQWQWRDDRGVWRSYTWAECRVLETAHAAAEEEVTLAALGRSYTVDLHAMQQVNEDTGTARPVQRTVALAAPTTHTVDGVDERVACVREAGGAFVRSLLAVLLEVYSSSAGPAVRAACLKAMLRMLYYASAQLLREVLKFQVISSQIAGMMASNDLRIVVGSLQLAEILMQKLPDEFGVHFRREGVMHQVNQLADPMVPLGASPPKVPPVPRPAAPSAKHTAALVAPTTTRLKSKGSVNVSSSRSSFPVGVAYHVATPAASTSGAALDVQHHQPVAISFSANSSFANSGMSMESLLSSASNGSTGGIDPATGATLPIPIPHHSDVPLNHRSQSPVALHFGDILKRKRAVKRTPGGGGAAGARHAARRAARHDDAPSSSPPPHQSHAAHHAHSSSSRSRLSGATSKTSSFLSSLHPSRWGRQLAHGGAGYSGAAPGSGKDSGSALAKTHSNANLTSQNREKARSWVRAQAARFVRGYAGGAEGVVHAALGALARLTAALRLVPAAAPADHAAALLQLRDTVLHADLSSFEVNHSGLIGALLHFLTYAGSDDLAEDPPSEELQARDQRLRLFLNIFAEMPLSTDAPEPLLSGNTSALSVLVSKVNACVSQLEQFPVRVHDLPARPATSALKFFNTHQLMCDLKRHPNCTNLKQWKGGVVRIDPLALVQAIERYLAMRGYAVPRGGKEAGGPAAGAHAAPAAAPDSDDDNASDDDIDDTLAAVIAQGDRSEHKLEFLIGDAVLPYNMTVYQAVRQYSAQASDQSETDTDTEAPLGNAGIWVQTHTIYYRSVESPEGAAGSGSGPGATGQTSGRKGKGSGTKSNPRRKTDDLWNDGIVPQRTSALHPLLRARLPTQVTVTDASLPALALLRSLHALSRHWSCLYSAPCHQISRMLLPAADFINAKLAAKASRQLQDPLVIMTGNLPQWLQQIAYVCPFVLPFECRHLLFYVVSFDRERALQRLLEAGGERAGATGADERVAPRLDRRKRTVARSNLLRQAEQLMHEYAHSKALLEVQYENEVGTGLGPTLEFYALVSLELQRADLDLWHGSENFKQKPSSFGGDIVKSHQAVIVNDTNDSPPPITITDPTANLASSVYNNLNLTEEQNRNNTNQNDNFESFDMPMIVDTSDVNLNESQQGRKETVTPGERPSEVTYVNWPCGLFPQAIGRNTKASQLSRIKAKFRFLGKFMAKAVMDSRMLDMPLSVSFYRWVVGEERCLSLADVRGVSPELWRSLCRLQQVAAQATRLHNDHALSPERRREMISSLELDGCPIEELGLDFILPGRGCTELRRGGRDTPVTAHNLNNYIQLVAYWMLNEGVNRQLEAFREGFESVFPLSNLKVFYPEELELIFCGSPTGGTSYQKWEVRTLAEWCRPDHGYTSESRAIRWLLEILASYDRQEQRLFLQFVTGSPRLPTGGFKALTPPLTVVRKTLEANVNPDDYLPSVMTCVNYLKLPDYSSQEVMRHKLRVAASEGQHSFHLS